jgi:hypothetical protein
MRRSLVLLVALATLVVSSGPARADNTPVSQPAGQAAPSGPSHVPRHRRIGLIAGGLTTWGVSYGLGLMAALSTLGSYNGPTCQDAANVSACLPPKNYEARDLVIPVVGPWLAIGAQPRDAALLALVGLGQVAGLTLLTVGIVGRADEGVPPDEHRGAPGARAFVSFGVLPTRDGAFGFLSGRM